MPKGAEESGDGGNPLAAMRGDVGAAIEDVHVVRELTQDFGGGN